MSYVVNVSWDELKNFINNKVTSLQYVTLNNGYYINAIENSFVVQCFIPITNPVNSEQEDFETNYKFKGNKSLLGQNPPFSAKTLPDGSKIFRRIIGITSQVQDEPTNIDFVVPFTKCKITGLQILGARLGDKVTFQILDTDNGTISGVPNAILNTFGQDAYIAADFAAYSSKYDADLIQGLIIRIIYDAKNELLPRDVYINFDLHEVVN